VEEEFGLKISANSTQRLLREKLKLYFKKVTRVVERSKHATSKQ